MLRVKLRFDPALADSARIDADFRTTVFLLPASKQTVADAARDVQTAFNLPHPVRFYVDNHPLVPTLSLSRCIREGDLVVVRFTHRVRDTNTIVDGRSGGSSSTSTSSTTSSTSTSTSSTTFSTSTSTSPTTSSTSTSSTPSPVCGGSSSSTSTSELVLSRTSAKRKANAPPPHTTPPTSLPPTNSPPSGGGTSRNARRKAHKRRLKRLGLWTHHPIATTDSDREPPKEHKIDPRARQAPATSPPYTHLATFRPLTWDAVRLAGLPTGGRVRDVSNDLSEVPGSSAYHAHGPPPPLPYGASPGTTIVCRMLECRAATNYCPQWSPVPRVAYVVTWRENPDHKSIPTPTADVTNSTRPVQVAKPLEYIVVLRVDWRGKDWGLDAEGRPCRRRVGNGGSGGGGDGDRRDHDQEDEKEEKEEDDLVVVSWRDLEDVYVLEDPLPGSGLTDRRAPPGRVGVEGEGGRTGPPSPSDPWEKYARRAEEYMGEDSTGTVAHHKRSRVGDLPLEEGGVGAGVEKEKESERERDATPAVVPRRGRSATRLPRARPGARRASLGPLLGMLRTTGLPREEAEEDEE